MVFFLLAVASSYCSFICSSCVAFKKNCTCEYKNKINDAYSEFMFFICVPQLRPIGQKDHCNWEMSVYVTFFCVPSYISGIHHFWWWVGGGWGGYFCICDHFWSNHRGSHILSSWMVLAGYVFVAGIHQSPTWMSGSFETVQWNAGVHRQDLGLSSHSRVFFGEC